MDRHDSRYMLPGEGGDRSDPLMQLEDMVRAAGEYVQPTDDLRPATLELAREQTTRRRGRQSILVLAFALCCSIGLSLLNNQLSPSQASREGQSGETPVLAGQAPLPGQLPLQHATAAHSHWGLYEAFVSFRRSLADRLGAAEPHDSID